MDGEKDPLLPCAKCGGTPESFLGTRNTMSQRLLVAIAARLLVAIAALVTLVVVAAAAVGGVDASLMPTRGGGQYRSLVWVAAGEHAVVEGAGCTGVLLASDWVLLAARCLPEDGAPITILAPNVDEAQNASEAAPGAQAVAGHMNQWIQQRHSVEVVRSRNEDSEKGAAPYPAMALIRTDLPFSLSKDLRPANLLWGTLDDARRPLRCSIAGWDVMGDEGKVGAVYPSDITWAPIGKVLTYAQCAEQEGLVERASQFCVEVAMARPDVLETVAAMGALVNDSDEAARRTQRRGLVGNPLLCAGGALAGVRYLRSGLPSKARPDHRVDVFVNATHLEPWIRQHVKDLKVVTIDEGIVVHAEQTTPVSVRRGHSGHIGRSISRGTGSRISATSVLFLTSAILFTVLVV